jgi:hypothetical protein
MDGRQLRTLFKQFNEEYWGGRLPAYAIRVVARMTSLGEWGRWLKKRKLIEIQRGLSDEDMVSTLLHEMAHAATNGGHGMPWKRDMIRLRLAGAPLANTDRVIRLDDGYGKPISRKQFRCSMQDLFSDAPELSLSCALRHFIRTEGGPPTIAAFLRKYPWARTVFNAEKRGQAEEQKRRIEFFALLRK